MNANSIGFTLAGYASQSRFDTRTIRLFKEHKRNELQSLHYADDWDEEDDANGWRSNKW
jgi:hypothetical protein